MGLGIFRITMKLGKWLKYERLTKDLSVLNSDLIINLVFFLKDFYNKIFISIY